MRLKHGVGHPTCPYRTWGECDAAWAEQKRGLVEKGKALEAERVNAKRAARNERIDRALAWHAEHPSVWDPMPSGYSGES